MFSKRPKARNPREAIELVQHKLEKKWPFLYAKGYDTEHYEDYHTYGKFVRQDNLPNVKSTIQDNSYFFLHSRISDDKYIFVHVIRDRGDVVFRGLMFENYKEAYKYAHTYGCRIKTLSNIRIDVAEFLTHETEDIDMFVDTIWYTYRGQHMKHKSSKKLVK